MMSVFCAAKAEPSDFTILHITYRRLRRKSIYSFPPGTVISIGASSVSKELTGLHSLKYILSTATWLGETVMNYKVVRGVTVINLLAVGRSENQSDAHFRK